MFAAAADVKVICWRRDFILAGQIDTPRATARTHERSLT